MVDLRFIQVCHGLGHHRWQVNHALDDMLLVVLTVGGGRGGGVEAVNTRWTLNIDKYN